MKNARSIISFLGLAIVVVVLEIVSGGALLTVRNVSTIVNELFVMMIGTSGLVFLMAQGNLDLSMMANVSFSCVFALYAARISPWLAFPVGIAVGAVIGLLNGLIHVFGKIDSFITTIGMSFVLQGLLLVVMKNQGSIAAPMEMHKMDSTSLRIIVLIVVVVFGWILFEYTKFGKYCKAIGSNSEAARQSGINVNKIKIISFVLVGVFCGLLSVFSMLRTGTATSSVATGTQFRILIAVLLGGVSITGGSTSRFRAAVIGSFTMAFLSVGMTICNVDTTIQQLIRGAIFLGIVWITYDREGIVIIK